MVEESDDDDNDYSQTMTMTIIGHPRSSRVLVSDVNEDAGTHVTQSCLAGGIV